MKLTSIRRMMSRKTRARAVSSRTFGVRMFCAPAFVALATSIACVAASVHATAANVAVVGDVTVVPPAVDPAVAARRATFEEGPPALRGFRAPILANANDEWPIAMPDTKSDARAAATAEFVAKHLAHDGLLATLTRVIEQLGADAFVAADRPDLLRQVGLPVDWLAYFDAGEAPSVVRAIAAQLASGLTSDEVVKGLSKFAFRFRPTIQDFQVATESGENDVESLRIQIGNDHYYSVEGDGGTVDLPREILTRFEGVEVVAAIQDVHVANVTKLAKGWTFAKGTTLTLLPQPQPVSQWAQDNGKPGFVGTGPSRKVALLVPRYASRGEFAAAFVPGDTFAAEALAATGRRVVQSPLLFQGGNLIAAFDPKRGKPELIVGEAELYRNMSMGLTSEQVREALRVEFGVERCIVIPATSFHVDYELTLRSTPDGLVAFMNDVSAAHRLVLRCAVPALERAGLLKAGDREAILADMDAGAWDKVLQGLDGLIGPKEIAHGTYAESFARHFSDGPADSGELNLQRVLLAMDVLFAERQSAADIDKLEIDPHSAAYLKSFRRTVLERLQTAQALAGAGMRIVGVPSTSEGSRSLTTINGVQVKGAYWMPAYGGLFADYDRAAQKVFEDTLGPGVRVIPIHCAESMRRDGALHCSISVLPSP